LAKQDERVLQAVTTNVVFAGVDQVLQPGLQFGQFGVVALPGEDRFLQGKGAGFEVSVNLDAALRMANVVLYQIPVLLFSHGFFLFWSFCC
jgi:hypothetical protein